MLWCKGSLHLTLNKKISKAHIYINDLLEDELKLFHTISHPLKNHYQLQKGYLPFVVICFCLV